MQYFLLYFFISLLSWNDGASAHENAAYPWEHNHEAEPKTETPALRTEPVVVENYGDVVAHIEAKGSVQIIVQVVIRDSSESLPIRLREARRELYELLSGSDYKLLQQYYSLPLLLLQVDRDALERLRFSPLVESLTADSLSHTMEVPDSK